MMTYNYVALDYGSPYRTAASGISNAGTVVGTSSTGSWEYALGANTFSALPYSGLGVTIPIGINQSGEIVGIYNGDPSFADWQSFLFENGIYSDFRYSDTRGSYSDTNLSAINDLGQFVGSYPTNYINFSRQGFVYNTGGFNQIQYPASRDTVPSGINNLGEVVGDYDYVDPVSGQTITNGFTETNGAYSTVQYPGAISTSLTGINDSGEITGYYQDVAGSHGFVESGGVFTLLDSGYVPSGINDSGDIVGYYHDPSLDIIHGFLATPVLSPPSPPVGPPQITLGNSTLAGTINELPNVTGSSSPDSATGAISFTDSDLDARPSAVTLAPSVTYRDANGNDISGQVPMPQFGAIEHGLKISPEAGNTNSGTIDWSYSIPDSSLDFLGAGETITVDTPVQISDSEGGSLMQDVEITINGANDNPTAAPDSAVAILKGSTISADAAHGVLSNDTDPDIHDTLRVSAVNGAAANVGHAVLGTYGALTLNADGSYSYVASKNLTSADTFSYSIDDGHGGTAISTLSFGPGAVPTVTSVSASPSTGDLNASNTVAITIAVSGAVKVKGTPTLSLNDGGTATYKASASDPTNGLLSFSYNVKPGENTPILGIAAVNTSSVGASVQDALGRSSDFTKAITGFPGLQIDTTKPTVSSVSASGAGITNGNGTVGIGSTVTLTVAFSEPVTVNTSGGTPTLNLNDGGKATYAMSSGNTLTFAYTVAAKENTSDLAATGLTLNGASIVDGAGNTAALSGAQTNPAGVLQVYGSAPAVTEHLINDTGASRSDLITSNDSLSGSGDPNAVVHFTVDGVASLATAVADSAGNWTLAPLSLVDGKHTIVASETDAAGNTGVAPLTFMLDTTPPTVSAVSSNASNGAVAAGDSVSIAIQMSEPVTVAGTPTLQLNDGGNAKFDKASSTSTTLVFDQLVKAGESASDLQVLGVGLPAGASIKDLAGNTADLSGANDQGLGIHVGGLVIKPHWDKSVFQLPAELQTAFEGAVQSAIDFFEKSFSNSVTLNITFGLTDLGSSNGGQNDSPIDNFDPYTFGQISSILAHSLNQSTNDGTAYSTLSGITPQNGYSFYLTSAQEKALGLSVSQDFQFQHEGGDGTIWLNGNMPQLDMYNFFSASRNSPTQYDAIGILEHEISEVMGRSAGVGSGYFTPLDLFRYTASEQPVVADLSRLSVSNYFSIDGARNLLPFSSGTGSQGQLGEDLGDWVDGTTTSRNSSILDAFGARATGLPGEQLIGATDLVEMDVLGWNRTANH